MALTKLQSITARLSTAEEAFRKARCTIWMRGDEAALAKVTAEFSRVQSELLLAGMREVAGDETLEMQELAVKADGPVPLVITLGAPNSGPRPFGSKLADILNRCRFEHWMKCGKQAKKVKPTDSQCIRTEGMLKILLAHVALDHCNGAPEEVLDPITPAEMAAFGFPGGLLSNQAANPPEPRP